MKVYNETKTQILEEYDLTKGKVIQDKIESEYHEATLEIPYVSAEENAQKAEREHKYIRVFQGYGGVWYGVTRQYDNGGEDCEEIRETEYAPAKEAYYDYEDILVYIPYTEEELAEHKLAKLRQKRKPLLEAFDIWEKAVLRGREQDDETIMVWYQAILDLNEEAIENVPERIKHYI